MTDYINYYLEAAEFSFDEVKVDVVTLSTKVLFIDREYSEEWSVPRDALEYRLSLVVPQENWGALDYFYAIQHAAFGKVLY